MPNVAFSQNEEDKKPFLQPSEESQPPPDIFDKFLDRLEKNERDKDKRRVNISTKDAAGFEGQNKYKFAVSLELGQFLEEHMEKGKKVDDFIASINKRHKQYSIEMLKQNEAEADARDNPKALDEIHRRTIEISQQYYDDLIDIVALNTKQTLKEYAKFISMYTLSSAVLGGVIGNHWGSYGCLLGIASGSFVGCSGSAILGCGGKIGALFAGKKAGELSVGETEVLKKIAQMGRYTKTQIIGTKTGILNLPPEDIAIFEEGAENGFIPSINK